MERRGTKIGKYEICGSCQVQLRKKGFLQISETQYLYPNGRVRVKKVPKQNDV